jgi:hypothetical protein
MSVFIVSHSVISARGDAPTAHSSRFLLRNRRHCMMLEWYTSYFRLHVSYFVIGVIA